MVAAATAENSGKKEDFGYMNAELPKYLQKELGMIKRANISPDNWRRRPQAQPATQQDPQQVL